MTDFKNITRPDGKIVGILEGNLYRKIVSESKHLFRIFDAWGLDYEILHTQIPESAAIRVTDREAKKIYQTTAAVWKEHGIIKHFKEGTTDHNVQVFLPRKFFDVINMPAV